MNGVELIAQINREFAMKQLNTLCDEILNNKPHDEANCYICQSEKK